MGQHLTKRGIDKGRVSVERQKERQKNSISGMAGKEWWETADRVHSKKPDSQAGQYELKLRGNRDSVFVDFRYLTVK